MLSKTNQEPGRDRNRQDQYVSSSHFPCLWLPQHLPATPDYRDSPTQWVYLCLVTQRLYVFSSQYVCRYSCPLYNHPQLRHTSHSKQTSLETDTLAHIPSLIIGFHVAAWASFAQSGLGFSAPIQDYWASGFPCLFQFHLWEAVVVREEFLFWFLLSHQVSVVILPVWCLRPSLSHK